MCFKGMVIEILDDRGFDGWWMVHRFSLTVSAYRDAYESADACADELERLLEAVADAGML